LEERRKRDEKFFTFNVLAVLLIFMVSASAWCDGVIIGPGELPQWHANSQVQLGWIFTDPINP